MANSPASICAQPGCPTTTTSGRYCEGHRPHQSSYDQWRGTSTERGYNSRWRKARLTFLRSHPLCAECQRQGFIRAASEVDHIIPHRGDQKLFWDQANWQPLCKPCHSAKTNREKNGTIGR